MNISLTKELEEYVAAQVRSGHYSSASEVVREALRGHLREKAERDIQTRIARARADVQAGDIAEATPQFFEEARRRIRRSAGGKSR
ncbi:type II toxin-antitoxin system ParD family antitoxin [Pseudaminobacter arsenicus]|uniref:Type II toxin-antitoxin system ParD family antitoxin n=1 Tax=Borborobacter arsenicus TaxID=1851146 RepID=A0A432VAG7_9HYPH|nr:type II toxin-antitoxin system ParD family antitoxin [Pseudaminobacter arsenicus]RUM99083.1 type II toxin-antitoxin system ParD family antitoxin [Pseudaminobacter arsenicus]